MTQYEIKLVLDKHKKWLNNKEGGERADLSYADLSYADLSGADLRNADLRSADLRDVDLSGADLHYAILRGANLSGADLHYAKLRGADLRNADLSGADLDFSCWPLWCGSLGVHIDERQLYQQLYHTLFNAAYSKYISDELKRALLTPEIVEIANRSHVVHSHDKPAIEPYKEET